MVAQVQLFKGDSFTDHRGCLRFVNEFSFPGVKRFYSIIHPDSSVVRAWQGHQVEHKYFYVAQGSFALAWVAIDNWDTPSPYLKAEYVVLKATEPAVLSVPKGFANGIKAMEDNSILLVYSDLTLQESSADRWSFDQQLWLNWQELNDK